MFAGPLLARQAGCAATMLKSYPANVCSPPIADIGPSQIAKADMATLIGIALLLGLFGLAWALDALMDHVLLKLVFALIDRLPVFRRRYRSQGNAHRYGRFRSKRKIR